MFKIINAITSETLVECETFQELKEFLINLPPEYTITKFFGTCDILPPENIVLVKGGE